MLLLTKQWLKRAHPYRSINEFFQSIGDTIFRVKGETDFEPYFYIYNDYAQI